ncbi:ABC transporter permease [Glaciibacter psychrotolerans]|uniref:Simple sugar transport system permease protein n=1 Tax=Glaciibacter psychrotolerans TaxID=670054 RepID=A0A7Z0EFM4_9MICO|nr:ABC transporter permease [Leifsonia psychrotolerans]NYJ20787.1 simple sugar transport system permease protein [Leifsonia psychrotolerans]
MNESFAQRSLDWLRGPIPTSIILAFAIGGVFILMAGADPIAGFQSMFDGSLGTGIGFANTMQRAIPLIGMAIAIAVAFRAGVINLGAEGQMVLGGLFGGIVALNMPGPPVLVILVACLVGVVVGAFWGVLAAAMQMWPGVPLLITTLLLNYPARYFASWLVRFPLKDPETSQVASHPFDPAVQIPLFAPPKSDLGQLLLHTLGKDNVITVLARTVNLSLIVVAVIVVIVIFMNTRTKFGFESGANGLNPDFARYSGVRTGWMTTRTMMLSGGISGLIGVMLVIGAPSTRIVDGALIGTNYAWTGLLVALLASFSPIGVVVAGLFFAAIIAGGTAVGRDLALSPQISGVIQGIVIVLIAFRVALPRRKKRTLVEPVADQEQLEEEVGRV